MKQAMKILVLLGLAFGLSACAGGSMVSRNAVPDSALSVATKSGPLALVPQYDVQAVRVAVPRDLRVSEANMFYPLADIVWRGEARGDRHAQVRAIVQEGLAVGTQGMASGRPVALDVEVTRFHSLTEKTRYTVGGVHSIKFTLTLRDVATGQVIDGPRQVVADVKGSGGARAIAEEQAGRTMRVVIVEHLAQVIRTELSVPKTLPMTDPSQVPEGMALVSRNAAPEIAGWRSIY